MDSKPRYCQVASNLDSNPKIRKAGRLGREVFLFALRRNAEPGNPVTGSLPGDVLEPWFVSDQLMMSESEACAGIEACVKANLLVREGAGWSIVGWEEHWGSRALTNAERQARFKEKHRSNVTDVTPPLPVTKVTHKKRGDKRKEEERRESGPGGPPDRQDVIDRFHELFMAASGGIKPDWSPKQFGMLKGLLSRHQPAEVIRRIEILFSEPPEFLSRSTPDFATLVQHFDKLATPSRRSVVSRDEIRSTTWLDVPRGG